MSLLHVLTQCCRAAIIVFCVAVYKNICRCKKWKTSRQSKLCSQTKEGQHGNSLKVQTLQIFFQIAYLPFQLYQNGFAWLPDPSESLSLLNVVQSNQYFSSNCHLFEFGFFSRAAQCGLISCSEEAEDRDKDLQGFWDGRQDHLKDTKISNPYMNHTN